MKTVGIIAEYNPFHNGHAYHIEKAKEMTGADKVIVIMSGDFVQRGAPSVVDKYIRTEMALLSGADAVFEMPSYGACSSAESFAACGVSLFNAFGNIDYLCFGSEEGDLELLSSAAAFLCDETDEYKEILRKYLSAGLNFPSARSASLNDLGFKSYSQVLRNPNNILAIEYLKALKKTKSSIIPVTVKREDAGYHSLSDQGKLLSATAIRNMMKADASQIPYGMPERCTLLLNEYLQKKIYLFEDDFSYALGLKLLDSNTDLAAYMDINDDLANRINDNRYDFTSISDFANRLSSKNLTSSRIRRALFHILLDQKKSVFDSWKNENFSSYIKLLGFRKDSGEFFKSLDAMADDIVIKNYSKKIPSLSKTGLMLYENDIYVSSLYKQTMNIRTGFRDKNVLSQPMCIK